MAVKKVKLYPKGEKPPEKLKAYPNLDRGGKNVQTAPPPTAHPVTGDLVLPKQLPLAVRTNTFKALRQAMAKVVREMAQGSLDPDFAKGVIWGLKEVKGLLKEEMEQERMAEQLNRIETLLKSRPDQAAVIDVDMIREAMGKGAKNGD